MIWNAFIRNGVRIPMSIKNNRFINIFSNAILVEKDLYAVTGQNELLSININDGSVACIKKVFVSEKNCACSRILYYDNSFILIPRLTNYIEIYQIDNWEKKVCFISQEKWTQKGHRFLGVAVEKNMLYLLPQDMEKILQVNLDSLEPEGSPEINVQNSKLRMRNSTFAKDYIYREKKLYIPCSNENMICVVSVEDATCEYQYIDNIGNSGICCVAQAENGFLILNHENELFIKNKENNIKKISVDLGQEKVSNMICYQNIVWIIPKLQTNIKYIDLKTDKVYEIEYAKEFRFYPDSEKGFRKVIGIEHKLYILPRLCNRMIIMNMETKEIAYKELILDRDSLHYLMNKNSIIYEGQMILLREFIRDDK